MYHYKTPKNYKKVFPMFQTTFKILEENALKNDSVNDIYYYLKKILEIAFERCSTDEVHCNNWLLWFEKKGSTLLLRNLFLDINIDYWNNLITGNAIDRLDSLQSEITNKTITHAPTNN